MVVVNFIYGHPWHRYFLKAFRLAMGLLIFIAPPVLAWFLDGDFVSLIRHYDESGSRLLLVGYLGVVWATAWIGLPYVTIRRLLRPLPAVVLSEQTRTINVAKELGERPVGDGKYAWLAQWRVNQLFNVDFTTLTVTFPNLPKNWDGLTLLHLSDLHFIGTPSPAFYEWIIEQAMAEGTPDLLLVTGDIVDTEEHHTWIRPLLGKLRWNEAAFAILGNHDWWYDFDMIREELRGLGMTVLDNRWSSLQVRGEPLTLIGHEGPWFQPPPDLSECPSDGFRLLLSHSPDNIRWARRHQVSLMLSGHNHGGQVRLPVFGSIFVPSQYSRRYDAGTYFAAPTLLHVNRGLSGKEPLRIRCNPQVTRIIMKRS